MDKGKHIEILLRTLLDENELELLKKALKYKDPEKFVEEV